MGSMVVLPVVEETVEAITSYPLRMGQMRKKMTMKRIGGRRKGSSGKEVVGRRTEGLRKGMIREMVGPARL